MASLAASHPPMQHGITVRGQRKSKNEIARFRALKRQNLAISEQAAAPKATLHQPLSLCSRATIESASPPKSGHEADIAIGPRRADSVEKGPSTRTAKFSFNSDRHLHSTFAGLTIRFRATYIASALGHAPLRVLVRKTPPGSRINSVGHVNRLFQHNRPIPDIPLS